MRTFAGILVVGFLFSMSPAPAQEPAAVSAPGKATDKKDAPQLDLDLLAALAKFEKQKQDRIEKLKKKKASKSTIERVESEFPEVGFLEFPLEVGAVGGLQLTLIKILNVVDDQNFIASIEDLKVPQGVIIYADRRPPPAAKLDAWFKGFDTRKMQEGTVFKLDGVVRVSGTKRYETVGGGTRQIVVVERFDLAPYYAELRRLAANADPKPAEENADKKPAAKAAPAKDPEEQAAAKLKLADQFLKAGKREAYRSTLADLVKKYPGTKAAKEAEFKLK